jgi:ATP-dependent DNA helicase DinG
MSPETASPPPRPRRSARAIRLAGGREVCFTGTVDDAGVVQTARVVARGDVGEVLALPASRSAASCWCTTTRAGARASDADLNVAARLHDDGIGFAIVDNDARGSTWWSRCRAPRPWCTWSR